MSRSYSLGNPDLDRLVDELISRSGDGDGADLIGEIITTAIKLYRDMPNRGDLKLVNTALKEMRYPMLVFSRHDEPKVTMYGSARLPEDDPDYRLAAEFGRIMVERGWGVITGAGPGIMEAGHRGAGVDASYGVNIRLPFESVANAYVNPDRTVNFKYFFTRKLAFVKESHGFALFPGGFGTLDEAFELLTLVQTGKSDLHPIVLIQSEETRYWDPLLEFVDDVLVARGLISPADLHLFRLTTDPEVAADEMCRFYANYQSQRYVDGKLVLRVMTAPDDAECARLTDEYGDILKSGSITAVEPTEPERRDGDALDCERVMLHFDRRSFGRLRQLIDELNHLVGPTTDVHPPAPFGQDQADRVW